METKFINLGNYFGISFKKKESLDKSLSKAMLTAKIFICLNKKYKNEIFNLIFGKINNDFNNEIHKINVNVEILHGIKEQNMNEYEMLNQMIEINRAQKMLKIKREKKK